MLMELAEVRLARRDSTGSANAALVSRWQSSKLPAVGVRAHVRRLAVEHRQLRFLRRADAALRIENHDARVRDVVERVRDGAAGVAGGRDQNRQRLVALEQRGHEPRHHARADVLERQRRAVKQLERVDTRLDFDERNGKRERVLRRSTAACRSRARRQTAAAPARRSPPASSGSGSRASSSGGQRGIDSGTYRPPSGAMPSNSANPNDTGAGRGALSVVTKRMMRRRARPAGRWTTRRFAARRRCAP